MMNTDVRLLLVGFLSLMGLDPDSVLLEGISYNPMTGVLYWRERHPKAKHGYVVASKSVPEDLREAATKFFTPAPAEESTDD